MAELAYYIVVGSWAVFGVYWLVAWFNVKRTVERESGGSRLAVLIPLAIGFYLIFYGRASRGLPESDGIYAAGSIAAIAGVSIAIWARRTLASNWSATVTFKEGHELIQHGPYRFVRHPIYTGFLLMTLGAAIVIGRWTALLGVAFATMGFWYKLRREEALMSRHFPETYPAYKRHVKALIPWLLHF